MLHNVAGWIGMALILLGYFLNSTGRVNDLRTYQLINFFGACGILWNAVVLKSWPVALLNLFWICIALHSLILWYTDPATIHPKGTQNALHTES